MYPTLYHALLDLTGLDIPFLKFANSFGFFVAIAFFVAAWTFGKELSRMQQADLVARTTRKVTYGKPASIRELIGSGLFGALLGFKGLYLLFNYEEATADPQSFLVSTTGSFIGLILGAALMVWLRYREKQKQLLDKPKTVEEPVTGHEHANNMALLAAIWGFSGAKVFHWLENPDQFMRFIADPAVTDMFSGLTMYGGLLVAGPMVIRYMMQNGILPWAGMDAVAPGLMWAYGVGRIGCHVSGDGDWGIANPSPAPSWIPEWLWSYDYPNNVNAVLGPQTGGTNGVRMTTDCFEGYCTHLVPGVYPTPVYETVVCVILGFILWHFRTRLKIPGLLFALYLMMNGFERFWIEKIRVNTKVWGNITQAEIISSCLFLLGLGLYIWLRNRGKNKYGTEATN